ncbi:hypothetical protein PMKS-003502 [Pichia membranifaciens]|uniref:Enhancer of polycomb-like protein n=1 Tax=Pichia membranifaciens TaxID=4926 RepID=A0A1Q2YKB4_9ASCO|nr:hypothetical protein PMKS-003502 [Pichia membranifaciens]
MGSTSTPGARFRQRKISVKQTLLVLKQKDIPDFDIEDQQRELQHFETGVEKGEEEEHHLQQVINASAAKFKGANVEQVYIPTPDASKVWKDASRYYHQSFNEPDSYIKFSATVEDTTGCPYNMDEVDDEFLQKLNEKFSKDERCTEDEFELIANKFDVTVDERQPFLTMDPQQILSFKEIKEYAFDPKSLSSDLHQTLANKLHVRTFKTLYDAEPSNGKEPRHLSVLFDLFGEQIYDHWKTRRIERGGKPVFPTLKFEDPSQKDDNNPYTCFRRREFRQARKTRRTDVQSIERLKLLYKDLRRAKSLFFSVAEKEVKKSELLQVESETFSLRNELKKFKRDENIKLDDELLIDKPKKKRIPLGYVPPPPTPVKSETDNIKDKLKNKDSSSGRGNLKKQLKADGAAHKRSSTKNLNNGANGNNFNNNNNSNGHGHPLNQLNKTPQVVIQPYVKLPPSKIPDIELTTVNTVLKDKLEGIKKAVSDKLIKRRLQDEGWINFTDDPYNPYFDMSNSGEDEIEQRSHLPYSSIISSMFEVENSREINFSHIFNNNRHYSNNDSEIVKVNLFTGQVVKNDRHSYLPEFYDLVGENPTSTEFGETREEIEEQFNDKNRFNVSEVLFKIRKRPGRGGRIWMDRKRITDDKLFEEYLNLPENEDEENEEPEETLFNVSKEEVIAEEKLKEVKELPRGKKRVSAYDSGVDSRKRLKSRFMFDADLPKMNPLDPSKLNQIGKQTQAIRFGCMLLSKAYDNMHQIRQKQILHHQQKLQQQQQQREQFQREQKERERLQLQQILHQQQLQQQEQNSQNQSQSQSSNGKPSFNGEGKNDGKRKDNEKVKDNDSVENGDGQDKFKDEKATKTRVTKEKKSKKDTEGKKAKVSKKATPKTSNKNMSDLSSSPSVKVKVESGTGVVDKVEKENKVDKLVSSSS